jgi:hypothetical protein
LIFCKKKPKIAKKRPKSEFLGKKRQFETRSSRNTTNQTRVRGSYVKQSKHSRKKQPARKILERRFLKRLTKHVWKNQLRVSLANWRAQRNVWGQKLDNIYLVQRIGVVYDEDMQV